MITTIKPSELTGTIQAPASKSSMQRACAAALLNSGKTQILNPGHSNDDKAALGVIRDLGATVETQSDGSLLVSSQGVHPGKDQVNCGESGLGIRMFAPIIAMSERAIRVNGEGSLLTRPMDFFDEIFPQLGIEVVSNKGKLPLTLKGPLQPRNITIDGSLSSQFLTGLLFSYAASGAKDAVITVNNLKSKPYIDLTLGVLNHFGWNVAHTNYEEFRFDGKAAVSSDAKHSGTADDVIRYTVEGDWSGGAFLLVAGAIAGPIVVRGLDPQSTQADKAILQALKDCGAAISFAEGAIHIGPASTADSKTPGGSTAGEGSTVVGHGSADGEGATVVGHGSTVGEGSTVVGHGASALQAFQFDATDCPDLFPPLVALAAYCDGVTIIDGVDRLAHKESNRGLTLRDEFGKMGLTVELEGNRMRVHGGKGLHGATVHSRHDHRIAMACAVAGLRTSAAVIIEEAEAISKSYPDFYDHLSALGAEVAINVLSTTK